MAGLGILLCLGELFLDGFQVGQREFRVDGLDVVHRADLAGNVRNIVVLETPDHMCDRMGFANIGKKLVAEAFAFRGAPATSPAISTNSIVVGMSSRRD